MRFPSRKGRGPQPDHWVDRPDVEAGTNDLRSRPVLIGRQPHHKHPCERPLCGSQPTTPGNRHTNTTEQHTRQPPPGVAHRKPPRPGKHPGAQGTRVAAATARGKRPDPSRTRKLRPAAPMVLHPGGCGRVGHRRTHHQERGPANDGRAPTRLNTPHPPRTGQTRRGPRTGQTRRKRNGKGTHRHTRGPATRPGPRRPRTRPETPPAGHAPGPPGASLAAGIQPADLRWPDRTNSRGGVSARQSVLRRQIYEEEAASVRAAARVDAHAGRGPKAAGCYDRRQPRTGRLHCRYRPVP